MFIECTSLEKRVGADQACSKVILKAMTKLPRQIVKDEHPAKVKDYNERRMVEGEALAALYQGLYSGSITPKALRSWARKRETHFQKMKNG